MEKELPAKYQLRAQKASLHKTACANDISRNSNASIPFTIPIIIIVITLTATYWKLAFYLSAVLPPVLNSFYRNEVNLYFKTRMRVCVAWSRQKIVRLLTILEQAVRIKIVERRGKDLAEMMLKNRVVSYLLVDSKQ
jgi:hypothetical protein